MKYYTGTSEKDRSVFPIKKQRPQHSDCEENFMGKNNIIITYHFYYFSIINDYVTVVTILQIKWDNRRLLL